MATVPIPNTENGKGAWERKRMLRTASQFSCCLVHATRWPMPIFAIYRSVVCYRYVQYHNSHVVLCMQPCMYDCTGTVQIQYGATGLKTVSISTFLERVRSRAVPHHGLQRCPVGSAAGRQPIGCDLGDGYRVALSAAVTALRRAAAGAARLPLRTKPSSSRC